MYAVRKDGQGWRAIDSKKDVGDDENFSATQPDAIAVDTTKSEITFRLNEIDLQSLRPLRAVWAGTSTDEDHAKLTSLENEANQLREELNAN